MDILGKYNTWPLVDILKKLVEASEVLLRKHDYDGHDYKEIEHCCKRGKEILVLLEKQEKFNVSKNKEECTKKRDENTCSCSGCGLIIQYGNWCYSCFCKQQHEERQIDHEEW